MKSINEPIQIRVNIEFEYDDVESVYKNPRK